LREENKGFWSILTSLLLKKVRGEKSNLGNNKNFENKKKLTQKISKEMKEGV